MNSLQTPQTLRQVRETLGLSQASVSAETGIDRSNISRFENGRLILNDEELDTLQDHYVSLGFDFSEIETEDDQEVDEFDQPVVLRDFCTIMDGFVLPEYYSPEEAEELLAELKHHEDYIEAELHSAPRVGFFGVDETNLRRRLRLVGLRGLRCYSINEFH